MEMIYRPLLPPTQYCPCDFKKSSTVRLKSLPQSRRDSPFYRALFARYTPLWINPNPARKDNSPDIRLDVPSHEQADIDFRIIFERQKKIEASRWDSTTFFPSLYVPRGRWQWTHLVTFEARPEEVRISCNQHYTLNVRTARVYQEDITYISKLWPRESQWVGFPREVMLHKTQLRAIHGTTVPALIGVHTNFDGIQMTYDVPHHSFWIQASPDMPDVLKRRCLQAYDQLHCQGVLHGNVELENILIGGDGRVKIINFDQSRSSKPNIPTHLEPATRQDFKIEMREVHYKLDYMDARRKERAVWENKDNPQALDFPTDNGSRIHARYPYSVTLEPPVDPTQWSLPDLWKPKRFVVPGQSAEQFEFHLQQFLLELEEGAGEGMNPPKFTFKPQGSKKRKRSDGDNPGRVRFDSETDHNDGFTRTKRRLVEHSPPPGPKRAIPRLPREYKENHGLGGGYAPNVPPDEPYPHVPPAIDPQRFSSWESSRSGYHRGHQDSSPAINMDSNGDESERASGKRKQVDGGHSSFTEGVPRAKRLRRTETTLLGLSGTTDTGPMASSSTQLSAIPLRYSLRSSSRRTQVNAGHSTRSTKYFSSRTTQAGVPRATPQASLNGQSSSLRPTRTSGPASPLRPLAGESRASSSSQQLSTEPIHVSSNMDSPPHNLTSTPDARAHALQNTDRRGGLVASSFGPIQVITYDQLAQYQSLERRSTIETVRLAAERLPNSIFTAANKLARTFGLW